MRPTHRERNIARASSPAYAIHPEQQCTTGMGLRVANKLVI